MEIADRCVCLQHQQLLIDSAPCRKRQTRPRTLDPTPFLHTSSMAPHAMQTNLGPLTTSTSPHGRLKWVNQNKHCHQHQMRITRSVCECVWPTEQHPDVWWWFMLLDENSNSHPAELQQPVAAAVKTCCLLCPSSRCAAGDAGAGGEEDLSLPADGARALGAPFLPDTTVQTPLPTH